MFFAKFKKILCPRDSERITNEMDKANVRNVNYISFIIVLYELITYFFVATGRIKVRDIKESSLSVMFIILFSLIFFIYSANARKKEKISHIRITLVTVTAFLGLSCYSIYLSYLHYIYGKDIITFYIVMVVFSAFIIIKPYISVILLLVSFTSCYIVLAAVNGADSIHILNYFAFALICCAASTIKYHLMRQQQIERQKVESLNDELKKAVRYDVQTKLKNHFALIEDTKNYLNKPIYIVMCDCDNFKHINDTYGHIAGDRALAAIADVFKSNLSEDSVYRYGGDEFLIVNDLTNADSFEQLKERIHAQLGNIRIEGIDERINCSFGRAYGTASTPAEFEALIKSADYAMYLEKQAKNR